MTPTIEQTTAEPTTAQTRRTDACENLRTVERKVADLPIRRARATAEIERLNGELAQAEAAGAEPTRLAELRNERMQQRQLLEDLENCGPVLDRELECAQGELTMAERACHAEQYNAIVKKQNDLACLIDQSVVTLVETMRKKEQLVRRQSEIAGNITPYGELNADAIRLAYLQYLMEHLQNPIPDEWNWPSLQSLDSSCRQMTEQGRLEEPVRSWIRST
ncbi:MAG: hypothetical protein AB7L09_15475 [Nitrospira sp.]